MKAWKARPLGELSRIEIGGTPPRSNSRYWDKDKATSNVWLSIGDMPKTLHARIVSSAEHLSSEGAARVKIVKAGTLLVSFKLTLGRLAYAGADLRTNEAIAALTLLDESQLQKEYLYWYLTFFDWEKAAEGDEKVKGKTLNKAKLADLPVLVPPLSEQRRIVAFLDEAFKGIATAKANADKNVENARHLLAGQSDELLRPRDGWERVSLAELLERGWITSHLDGNHGGDYPRKEEFVSAGVPYIAASAIKGGAVDFAEAKYLSEARAATIRKGLAMDRDVLFAHNATVGPVAILSTTERVVILGTSLTYYRCDPDRIHPEYLAHFMLSPGFTSQYEQVMKQSTRNQVPITKQREFFHVIPPLEEQRKIASRLDEVAEQVRRLEQLYERKLAALDDLKQSLLHQAFTGQL